MCGIFGAVGCGLDEATGTRALGTLAHRGPDGSGTFLDSSEDVFLGHMRLSIIDLSEAGRQPMTNEDGSLQLVLNGELYNHEELRLELEAKGHVFRGKCDAEVVLHLYEEEGEALLDRLIGMFAFALWDGPRKRLFVARDRVGIKPLQYYFDGRRFAFASELKAIVAVPGLDLESDVTAYWDFLTYGHVPAPKTIYKRARKLPAGHCLTLEFAEGRATGEPRVRRWWDADFTPNRAFTRPEEALEELGPLFERVVSDHLIADVPVGSFLSGGLDSTIVTTQAQQLVDTPIETFTIRFPRGKHDESTIAADNARALGLHAHVQDFDVEDLQERLPLARELFDEPFGDHSFLPTLAVSELASKTMKVVLSGDGGDETHAGYGRYYKAEKRRRVNALSDTARLAAPLLRATALTRISNVRNALEGPLGRLCHWYGGIPAAAKREFCEPLHPDLKDYDDYWLYREHERKDFSPIARQQYMDLKTTLPEAILTKVDRASMRCGLEVRPPLLDHRLVELAASLPDELKHEDGQGKVLLRRVLDERLAAPNVNAGPKLGFSIPLDKFVREDGLFRQDRDVVVADAFRIDAAKLAQTLSLKRDSQKWWLIHQAASFRL